ncbi:cytochrome P450 [Paraphaeosphaeria sporulosa]|uniref:Cytochrome P450 n=1 Tax=Paraphaeosphaeria sporulosa TaxID=1460663 RepID=A0A177BVM1_9PLEO|nr:cytochrome P450 [Paraphaeosphaeria sporulosa]OAF98771.1 cytochrome P450 [Paraphaeosphaeria sporulosa]
MTSLGIVEQVVNMKYSLFHVMANRDHISTLFRSSKTLTSKTGTIFALTRILNTPKDVIPFYAADDSGMATKPRKESKIRHEDRIHYWQAHTSQKWLSGASLQLMSETYLSFLDEELSHLNINEEWVEIPDLYRFLQIHVSTAAIKAMMGTKILEMYPNLVKDFWAFDRNVGNYSRLIPRWWMPAAYSVRDRLLKNIGKWTDYAHSMSDCSRTGPDDTHWDPYFGTKLMKAREHAYLKMPAMNLDARASETLGLLFASNGNAVPATFWYITEALKDLTLQDRLMSEVMTCRKETGCLDVTELATKPLLQSTYAEVLRLRIAITMIRSNEYESTHLGPYNVPKQTPMAIFSRLAALNRDAWAIRPRTLARPLEEFWPERFLVGSEEDRGGSDVKVSQEPSIPTIEVPKFSLDGLAGCWIPFGGGQRMCPGRHFAKHEILGTFSVLMSKYHVEAVSMVEAVDLQPDLSWAPYGGLPPAGQLRVRMRKRTSTD